MEQNQTIDMSPMFAIWMKSVTDFWETAAKIQAGTGETSKKSQKGIFYKTQKSAEFSAKMIQALMSKLSEPDNVNEFLKNADTIPDIMMSISQNLWDGFFEIQKQWTDRAARIGQETKAYRFDDIDHEIFRKIREIYEKEFQKFLHVPQIGLTRFYQERFNRFIDKFNIFQTALNEFLYMFYIPIEKSLMVMQEKVEKMAEEGQVHDNFKDYYNMWIKTLEGHYMTLLQSPEYTQVMDNTIQSLVSYRQSREELWYDLLQNVPVPTNKDMDDLYKEFYLLKKKVRELSKQVEQMRKEETHEPA